MEKNKFVGFYSWMLKLCDEGIIKDPDELYIYAGIYGLTNYNGTGWTGSLNNLRLYLDITYIPDEVFIGCLKSLIDRNLIVANKQNNCVYNIYTVANVNKLEL